MKNVAVCSLFVLVAGLVISSCSIESKSETCNYNGREISCEDFNRITKDRGATPTPTPAATPRQIPDLPRIAPVRGSQASAINCLVATAKVGLNDAQETKLCSLATVYTAMCVTSADTHRLSGDEIVSVCASARADSSVCLETADKRRLTRDETVELCR